MSEIKEFLLLGLTPFWTDELGVNVNGLQCLQGRGCSFAEVRTVELCMDFIFAKICISSRHFCFSVLMVYEPIAH